MRWHVIHVKTERLPECVLSKRKSSKTQCFRGFLMVEHRGVEPLTSTMRIPLERPRWALSRGRKEIFLLYMRWFLQVVISLSFTPFDRSFFRQLWSKLWSKIFDRCACKRNVFPTPFYTSQDLNSNPAISYFHLHPYTNLEVPSAIIHLTYKFIEQP